MVSQKDYIIFHSFGKGFGYIDSHEIYHELTSEKPFNQYTLQFQISGDQLLIQNGNSLEIYHMDLKKFRLKHIGNLNLTVPFLDISILKITGSENGFHLFTGDYILTVKFFHNGKNVHLIQQQYLGPWNTNTWLFTNGHQFTLDRGDAIQTITQTNKIYSEFQTYYSNDNQHIFPLKGVLIINQNKNFEILAVGQSYFGIDRKSTRLNSSHVSESRMPSSA